MNSVTPVVPEKFATELIRRGLPVEYAQRAAQELADHRCDVISELELGGMESTTAAQEAARRLGDDRLLVKKTVREFQRRHWCARWRLFTFLLAPIPALVAVWYAMAMALWLAVSGLVHVGLIDARDADAAFCSLPTEVKYTVLVGLFLVVPAAVMYGFGCLARRAALGWPWIALVACLLGLFVGDVRWERIGPGSRIVMRDRQTLEAIEQPPQHDFVIMVGTPFHAGAVAEMKRWWLANPVQIAQLLLPAAVGLGLILRGKQLARQRLQLSFGSC